MRLVTCQFPCKQDNSWCRGGWYKNRKKEKEGEKKKTWRRNQHALHPVRMGMILAWRVPWISRCYWYYGRKSYLTSTSTAAGKTTSRLPVLQQEKLHHIYRYCSRKSYITSTGTAAGKATSHLLILYMICPFTMTIKIKMRSMNPSIKMITTNEGRLKQNHYWI